MPPKHSTPKSFAVPRIAQDLPVLSVPVFCGMHRLARYKASALGEELIRVELERRSADVPTFVSSHEVREAFLQIRTMNDAISFTELYGPLDKVSFTLAYLFDLQQRVTAARELNPKSYFPKGKIADLRNLFERYPWPCQLMPGRAPYLLFSANNVEDAVHQATYVDQIAGIRVSTCPECKRQFTQRKNVKPKKFCDGPCQGRDAKRRYNAREEAKRNGKG